MKTRDDLRLLAMQSYESAKEAATYQEQAIRMQEAIFCATLALTAPRPKPSPDTASAELAQIVAQQAETILQWKQLAQDHDADYTFVRDNVMILLSEFCHDGDEAEPFLIVEGVKAATEAISKARSALNQAFGFVRTVLRQRDQTTCGTFEAIEEALAAVKGSSE